MGSAPTIPRLGDAGKGGYSGIPVKVLQYSSSGRIDSEMRVKKLEKKSIAKGYFRDSSPRISVVVELKKLEIDSE